MPDQSRFIPHCTACKHYTADGTPYGTCARGDNMPSPIDGKPSFDHRRHLAIVQRTSGFCGPSGIYWEPHPDRLDDQGHYMANFGHPEVYRLWKTARKFGADGAAFVANGAKLYPPADAGAGEANLCPACHGNKHTEGDPCTTCRGAGRREPKAGEREVRIGLALDLAEATHRQAIERLDELRTLYANMAHAGGLPVNLIYDAAQMRDALEYALAMLGKGEQQ